MQYWGDQGRHAEMRRRVFEFLESLDGREVFGHLFDPEANSEGSLESYVADRRRDRIWGGEFEYGILAQLFQVRVEIHYLACIVGGRVFQSDHDVDDEAAVFEIKVESFSPLRLTGGGVVGTMGA